MQRNVFNDILILAKDVENYHNLNRLNTTPIVAVKAFLYVGANLFIPHIAMPIYLLCICNKIGENTGVMGL